MRATGGDDMDDFISAPKVKWQSVALAVRSLHLQAHVASVGAPRWPVRDVAPLQANNIVQDSLCQVQQNALPAMGHDESRSCTAGGADAVHPEALSGGRPRHGRPRAPPAAVQRASDFRLLLPLFNTLLSMARKSCRNPFERQLMQAVPCAVCMGTCLPASCFCSTILDPACHAFSLLSERGWSQRT